MIVPFELNEKPLSAILVRLRGKKDKDIEIESEREEKEGQW